MAAQLSKILEVLGELAPLNLAEVWDNVGLLVRPRRLRRVRRILLTIDFTEGVLEEARQCGADLVVAYHPPIFQPVKRLDAIPAAGALESGVAVYSPHTALDNVEGGVNDWLCDGLGAGRRKPLRVAQGPSPHGDHDETCKVVVFVPARHADALREALAAAGAGTLGDYTHCSFGQEGTGAFLGGASTHPAVGRKGRLEKVPEVRLEIVCPVSRLPEAARAIGRHHPYEEPAWDIYPLRSPPRPDAGAGRRLELDRPVTIGALVERVKRHLGIARLRVAAAPRHRRASGRIRSVALCAGAGGSLLHGCDADCYLTGEMRHHDILAALAAGRSVILTEHTHSERGYLQVLRRRIGKRLGRGVKIAISRADREPLAVR